MKLFEREMAMPKWKYTMFKTMDILRSKEFWKKLFEGIILVLGTTLLSIAFWMIMWIFGEDELKVNRENPDYQIKQNTTYQKAD